MRAQDQFIRKVLRVCAPLLVWGVHFFFCYLYVAAACTRTPETDGRVVLATASLLALAAIGWLLMSPPRSPLSNLQNGARLGIAWLSLIGVLLSCVPMLMLPLCSGR